MQVINLHLTYNVTLPHVLFKHFASNKQLPGFLRSETLVENELTFFSLQSINIKLPDKSLKNVFSYGF